jgi:hypothetical protein
MQTQTLRAPVALIFSSRKGGLFYWARSVTAGNWPTRLQYRTMILVNSPQASQGTLAQLRAR